MGSQSHWYIGGVQRTAILFICLVTLDTSVNHRSNALHPFGQTRSALQLQHWLFCYCSAVSRTLTRKREHPVSYCAWHRRWQGRQKTLEDLNLLLLGSWWQGGTREGHLSAFLPFTVAEQPTPHIPWPSFPDAARPPRFWVADTYKKGRGHFSTLAMCCPPLLCSACASLPQLHAEPAALGSCFGQVWVWLMFSPICRKSQKM